MSGPWAWSFIRWLRLINCLVILLKANRVFITVYSFFNRTTCPCVHEVVYPSFDSPNSFYLLPCLKHISQTWLSPQFYGCFMLSWGCTSHKRALRRTLGLWWQFWSSSNRATATWHKLSIFRRDLVPWLSYRLFPRVRNEAWNTVFPSLSVAAFSHGHSWSTGPRMRDSQDCSFFWARLCAQQPSPPCALPIRVALFRITWSISNPGIEPRNAHGLMRWSLSNSEHSSSPLIKHGHKPWRVPEISWSKDKLGCGTD
jgi:hypothetical protein